MELRPWSVQAINLAEHANNVVHTDAGARAAGFRRALVAGTTVYAYLSHVPAEAWGEAWLQQGGAEVRFLSPVHEDDIVECVPADHDRRVEATVAGSVRSTLTVERQATPIERRVGEDLAAMDLVLDDGLAGYGLRAGDDLALYADREIVHPATWPVVGNRVTMAHLVTGPWIHVRSRVVHLGLARVGATARVESSVVDRFDTRAGHRAVLDVRVSVDGNAVAAIEHESIIWLADADPIG